MLANTMFKKPVFIVLCISLCILLFCSFYYIEKEKKEIPIHSQIQTMLNYMDVKNNRIINIADYQNISIKLDIATPTHDDINTYIQNILLDNNLEELSIEFIQDKFKVESIDEFNQYVIDKLKTNAKIDALILARHEVMNEIIRDSKFSMDNANVANYSLEIVQSYANEASISGMSLENYIGQVLNMNEEEFYSMCYDEGASLIEKYLVIGAIAERESLSVSEEEIQSFIESNNELSPTDETKSYITYQILENKIYSMFIKESVS